MNEKQIHILEVAEQLFSKNGFDGTSIRQISKEAGINIAMISYYFGSKEKMLEALLLYRTADFKMLLDTVLSGEGSIIEILDDIIALIVSRIHKNRRMYKIVHFEYSNANEKRNIDFKGYLDQKRETYLKINDFVEQGQQAGLFTKTVYIPLILPTILGTYFHFYYNKDFFMSQKTPSPVSSMDAYVQQILTPHIQKTVKALLTSKGP